MALTGLSIASLQASLREQNGLLKLKSLSVKLPEAFLTGTLMGILIGAIQKLKKHPTAKIQETPQKNQVTTPRPSMEHEVIDRFIKQNNLPPYSKLIVDQNDKITILWDSQEALQYFGEKHPNFFKNHTGAAEFRPLNVTISLSDPIPRMELHLSYKVYTYDGYDPWIYTTTCTRIKWLRKYLVGENAEIPAQQP